MELMGRCVGGHGAMGHEAWSHGAEADTPRPSGVKLICLLVDTFMEKSEGLRSAGATVISPQCQGGGAQEKIGRKNCLKMKDENCHAERLAMRKWPGPTPPGTQVHAKNKKPIQRRVAG